MKKSSDTLIFVRSVYSWMGLILLSGLLLCDMVYINHIDIDALQTYKQPTRATQTHTTLTQKTTPPPPHWSNLNLFSPGSAGVNANIVERTRAVMSHMLWVQTSKLADNDDDADEDFSCDIFTHSIKQLP